MEDLNLPEWRNAKYNSRGTIDIEINHPRLGWIPFTADPVNGNPMEIALYNEAIELGNIEAYIPPTVEETRASMGNLNRKQFRLGMRNLGITSNMISSALESISDENEREIALIEWEDSDSYQRTHPLVIQLTSAFGKTEEEVDDAWQNALTYV